MRFGREIKFRRRAPAPDLDVIVGAVSNRNTRVRQVREFRPGCPATARQIRRGLLQLRDLLAQILRLLNRHAGVLPTLFQLGNFFRRPVALRLTDLGFRNGLPPLRIHLAEVLQHRSRIHPALPQLLLYHRQVFTNKIQIKHGNLILYRKRRAKCTQRMPESKAVCCRKESLCHSQDGEAV